MQNICGKLQSSYLLINVYIMGQSSRHNDKIRDTKRGETSKEDTRSNDIDCLESTFAPRIVRQLFQRCKKQQDLREV